MAKRSREDKAKFKQERALFKQRFRLLLDTNDNFTDEYTAAYLKEDGKAHIVCDLRGYDNIFAPFSGREELSSDIYSYIRGEARYLRVATPVVVEFILSENDAELEKAITKLYYGNYRFDFYEGRHEWKVNNRIAWVMAIVGVIVLTIYALLTAFAPQNFYNEIVSIIAWVCIWEATEKFMFSKASLDMSSMRDAQLATASLEFRVPADKED